MSISLIPLVGMPAVRSGDDLTKLLASAIEATAEGLRAGDVLVVCQKVVSKAEGRLVRLSSVRPSSPARDFAERYGKDAALVELALREATEVLRMDKGHLITATGPGWVCANSGIDRSNQDRADEVTLLPRDADASAEKLRSALSERFSVELAVIVSDTFGRPWRLGQIDVAIGAAGIEVLHDHSGERDWTGKELAHTALAVADQLAAAAGLLTGKAAGVPAVLIRGLSYRCGRGRAAALVRPPADDLFR